MDISKEIQKYRQEIKSERMDMSFGEIINMYRDKEIIISPEYQRAFRWDEQRQSDFIESILLGIPFPSILLRINLIPIIWMCVRSGLVNKGEK